MTTLMRVKTRWTGFSGAPGYTVMHFRDFGVDSGGGGDFSQQTANDASTRVYTFFAAIRTLLPAVVRLNIEQEVDVIEDTTGDLVNSFSTVPQTEIVGTATGTYNPASGAVVNWRTAGIRNGRRIRGRSFIVPLGVASYSAEGMLLPASRTTIQTAASALANTTGTPDLMVYARPTSKDATDGVSYVVNSAQVPSMLAILRSRRD